MADEQYRWLDRETAESLLRGESLEAVDPAVRDQAERLAKTLEGLTVEPPPGSVELPGEAAALAAFRAARSDAGAERSATGPRAAAPPPPDAGLVRISGPGRSERSSRRGRSARFVLTAVLAAGMVGGVAVAATSGVLPTPFGHDRPGPGASVSAAVPQQSPLMSPSPGGSLGEPTPDGSTGASSGPAIPPGSSSGGATSAKPGSGSDGRNSGGRWRGAALACSDLRDGKELGTGRRRALEGAAGSSDPKRVGKYCKHVLALTDGTSRRGKGQDRDGKGDGKDQGDQNGPGGEHGQGGDQGDQGGDDDGHGILPGVGTAGAGASSSPATLLPKQLIRTPTASPSPTYSAL
ncbi:hypothetical protein [Streptomyces sp. NPDC048419]|uniref:hypothetical protein n=1 Tax=Streptomyces sp. NPDC048419 TaxID=3365547 RepID=UPI00371EBFB6